MARLLTKSPAWEFPQSGLLFKKMRLLYFNAFFKSLMALSASSALSKPK